MGSLALVVVAAIGITEAVTIRNASAAVVAVAGCGQHGDVSAGEVCCEDFFGLILGAVDVVHYFPFTRLLCCAAGALNGPICTSVRLMVFSGASGARVPIWRPFSDAKNVGWPLMPALMDGLI